MHPHAATSTATAHLSWDPDYDITDLPAPITAGTPLYVVLEGATDVQALGIELNWAPDDLVGPCYYIAPDTAASGACGVVCAIPPSGGLGADSTFGWSILFAPGSDRRCVVYRVRGDNCSQRPASFCLASVQVMNSNNEISSLEITGGATLFGGVEEACPLALQTVTPEVIEAGASATLSITGSPFATGATVQIALADTTVTATTVDVLSESRLTAVLGIPRSAVGGASVIVSSGASSDTLADALQITPEVSYGPSQAIVWFAHGVVALPQGATRVGVSEAQYVPQGVRSLLQQAGVVTVGLAAPSLIDPTNVIPLGDPALLDICLVQLADTSVIAACQALQADSAHVLVAHPNWYLHTTDVHEVIPSDGLFAKQWWLKNTGQWSGVAGEDAHITRAWGYSTGGAPVDVVVLDTGVEKTHPDLVGRVFHRAIFQENQIYPPPDSTDQNGHGTSVSGIIAAQGNGGGSVAGVDWTARINSVKIANDLGMATMADLENGVSWAAHQGYKIANISAGSGSSSAADEAFYREAFYAGMVIYAGSGNDNGPAVMWPASYKPYVIAVGAMANSGQRWDDNDIDWSVYGGRPSDFGGGSDYGSHLDFVAPGGRFIETTNLASNGNYWYVDPYARRFGFGGTSAAAPVATGVAALVQSYCGMQLDGEDLGWLLKLTARDVGVPGWDAETANGVVNAERAIATVQPGIRILHDSTTTKTELSQQSGYSTYVNCSMSIPTGPYTGTRHVYRITRAFTPHFAGTPLLWWRQLSTTGVGVLPANIYCSLNPQATIVSVDSAQAVFEMSLYELKPTIGSETYWWPADPGSASLAFTAIGFPVTALGVDIGESSRPLSIQPRPAVARSSCSLLCYVPTAGVGSLDLFDVAGRRVRSLMKGPMTAGAHEFGWRLEGANGARVAPGLYLARLTVGRESRVARLVVVR